MSKQYDIHTMGDLVTAATESGDLDTLFTDLRTWVELNITLPEDSLFKQMFKVKPVFRWNDDGAPGLSGINIDLGGNK